MVCAAMRASHFSALAYEYRQHKVLENFLGRQGFLMALARLWSMQEGCGFVSMAPTCSSFVFLNRNTSGRSVSHPLGHYWLPYVANGSLMASRCVVLIFIMEAMGLLWCLEQPQTSILAELPAFQFLVDRRHVWQMMINMSMFGTVTKKPTRLYVSHPHWQHLSEFANAQPNRLLFHHHAMATSFIGKDGSRKVTGKSRELRDSQMYSAGYGRGVAALFGALKGWLSAQFEHSLKSLESTNSDVDYHAVVSAPYGPFEEWARLLEVEAFASGSLAEDPAVVERAACSCASCSTQDAQWRKHRMHRY